MHLLRSAERVLGITCNQFTLKNTLNDTALYESIKQFRQNYRLTSMDEQWSKVTAFISLLYAKALNINEEENPVLHWNKQRNGLLKKQFELASALDLIVEANDLSRLEYYYFKKITPDSLSTKLYFKSLDIVKQLNNEQIYLDLKQSIDGFHVGLRNWSKFEENFFEQNDDRQTKLTFDNYSDYLLMMRDQNQFIRNWEKYVQSTYANLLGYACSSMSILGDHNYNTWKTSFDFGSSFAFNYTLNRQFINYFDGPDHEQISLQLPTLMYLKLIRDEESRKTLIKTMLDKRYCSMTALKLKAEVKNSDETLSQIKVYGQTYLKQTRNCLNKLKESDSKDALLNISDKLLHIDQQPTCSTHS